MRPAWQTEELEDEWIDQEEEDEQPTRDVHNISDLSLTQPIGSVVVRRADTNGDESSHSASATSSAAGTFLIREDAPVVAILPKTPGKGKKNLVKDFFSPLALERMFEPPSPPDNEPTPLPPSSSSRPPAVPSRLSQMYIPSSQDVSFAEEEEEIDGHESQYERHEGDEEGDRDEDVSHHLDVPDTNYQFTFNAPRPSPFNPNAQSTPGPTHLSQQPPSTDPRLRLFHLQYDTFTRDHLSAMVDSIAVNTPSGGTDSVQSGRPSPTNISRASERSISRLRSAKRIKLSPASDFSSPSGDGTALIMRPAGPPRDYVGESKNLMDKIRQTRDFSTISTNPTQTPASAKVDSSHEQPDRNLQRIPRLNIPAAVTANSSRDISTAWTAASSKPSTYSSLAYREQAANLMALIRNDVKSTKRLFSADTEASRITTHEPDLEKSNVAEEQFSFEVEGDTEILPDSVNREDKGTPMSSQGQALTFQNLHQRNPSVTEELTRSMDRVSLDSEQLLEQFPIPPIGVLTIPPTAPSSPAIQAPTATNTNPTINSSQLAPPTGAAPAYPSSSLRSGRNEDLTRFVSSSTASGTTITAGSAASFVKHQGPKQIMHIAPSDIPALPERVGKMVFDKVLMKWVKATPETRTDDQNGDNGAIDGGNDSEDPFRDIESLRESEEEEASVGGRDDSRDVGAEDADAEDSPTTRDFDKSQVGDPAESEVEDEEEIELTSFSFDGLSMEVAHATASGEYDNLDETITDDDHDNDDEESTGRTDSIILPADDSYLDYTETQNEAQPSLVQPAIQDTPPSKLAPSTAIAGTPNPATYSNQLRTTPIVRSAMKSASITPVSALKDPNRSRMMTPAQRLGHRRSVSFSDGKRDGPILGVGRNAPTPDDTVATESELEVEGTSTSAPPMESMDVQDKTASTMVPSARSKRIADMLEGLEDSAFQDESPSKASSGRPPADELQPLTSRKPSSTGAVVGSPERDISRKFSFPRPGSAKSSKLIGANATFLTECSFGVSHDRLVQVITDVQPFEPYWEELSAIDLSKKNLDSVARLKEFLPRLDLLSLNSNQLSWLSGIPGTVRTLSVASNCLTGVTSFNHLLNLESLDISNNSIDSLRQLECLRHLRELKADGNHIDSIDGLQKMDGLVKLSLEKNDIRHIELSGYRWTRLEMLNLSCNRIAIVNGISQLPALIALNLDNNQITELEPNGPMPRLRILRVSGNRLQQLNAAPFPNLRTLYADNDSLGAIIKANRLSKVENLSLRNQGGRLGLNLNIRDVRDVKRLYLSGNPLKSGFISEPCYNLVYLEIAACRLTSLPLTLSQMVPNLRVLNLNYNFLDDTRALEGLTRLRKLTIIGSRIKSTKQLVRVLKGMQEIEMLDFRMNPCTLGWYLPLLVKDVPGALQPSSSDGDDQLGSSSSSIAQRVLEAQETETNTRNTQKPTYSSSTNNNNGSNSNSSSKGVSELQPPIVLATEHNGGGSRPSSASNNAPISQSSKPKSSSSHSSQATTAVTWKDLDSKFRRDLPDDAYVGRMVYRGMVMRSCPMIKLLDGVEEKKRLKEGTRNLGIIDFLGTGQ
ncbi:Cell Division and Infection-Related Protein [Abortiporus biennis]